MIYGCCPRWLRNLYSRLAAWCQGSFRDELGPPSRATSNASDQHESLSSDQLVSRMVQIRTVFATRDTVLDGIYGIVMEIEYEQVWYRLIPYLSWTCWNRKAAYVESFMDCLRTWHTNPGRSIWSREWCCLLFHMAHSYVSRCFIDFAQVDCIFLQGLRLEGPLMEHLLGVKLHLLLCA